MTQKKKKKVKKVFLDLKSYNLFIYFTVLVSLTPISQFFSFFIFIIFFTIFTSNETFRNILLLSNVKNTINFITYILHISMLPITENNSKYLFIIYYLNNTNHIFTTSICKLFIVSFIVWIGYLKKIIFNNKKYIYFLITIYLFCYYYRLIFFRPISVWMMSFNFAPSEPKFWLRHCI